MTTVGAVPAIVEIRPSLTTRTRQFAWSAMYSAPSGPKARPVGAIFASVEASPSPASPVERHEVHSASIPVAAGPAPANVEIMPPLILRTRQLYESATYRSPPPLIASASTDNPACTAGPPSPAYAQ